MKPLSELAPGLLVIQIQIQAVDKWDYFQSGLQDFFHFYISIFII